MKSYDLVVIGSGPAGEKAAVKAAYFGKKVALVEKSENYGGAGVQTGTIPSKTLKETAVYLSGIYQKGVFGIDRTLGRKAGISDFMYRKDHVTADLGTEVKDNLNRHGVDIFQGTASFEDAHKIRIDGPIEEVIRGDFILVATGSYPYHPDNIPFDGALVHDSDSILGINKFPKSICVLGAGVIGCEYATIFAAMGTQVFMVNNRDKILGFLDHDISNALVGQMKEMGVHILFNNSVKNIEKDGDGRLMIALENEEIIHTDMFLFAAGRSGNIRKLNIQNAGLEEGPRETLMVDGNFQTSVDHIYAVGDVIGFPALASTSMDQGRIAVAHMFKTKDLEELTQYFPYGIYTVPEVSMVGMTEDEAVRDNVEYSVGYSFYDDIARGRIMGNNDHGFLKVIFEKNTRTIIGVHIIGSIATEIIHFGLSLVKDRKTLDDVIATVFNYPTLHDLYKYACYDGLGNLSGHKIKNKDRLVGTA